jgi:hypothetical protein
MAVALQVMEDQNAAHAHHGPNHRLMQELQGNPAVAPAQPPAGADAHSQHHH